jgi:pimeloyl-ACP methyl ester carboxylesterase
MQHFEPQRRPDYADQAKGLLDHLGIARAFIMGSCLGCSPVIAFAARYPQACRGLVLAQPSGGVKRRLTAHHHFNMHRRYVQDNGLEAVVELARTKGSFPRAPGIWRSVYRVPSIGTCISNPNPQTAYGIGFLPSWLRTRVRRCTQGRRRLPLYGWHQRDARWSTIEGQRALAFAEHSAGRA